MPDKNLQLIAGVLALFFLAVAIVKTLLQRAHKREAAKQALAQSNASTVSLHNPYPNGMPVPGAESAAPAPDAPAAPAPTPAPVQPPIPAAPAPAPAAPSPPPPTEQVYKWN